MMVWLELVRRCISPCLGALLLAVAGLSAAESPAPASLPPEVVEHLRKTALRGYRLDLAQLRPGDIVSADLDGEGFRARLTYRSDEHDERVELTTLRRRSGVVATHEQVRLDNGCTPAEVAEIRVAIRERLLPTGPMFLTYVSRKRGGTYAAGYTTDRHPLGGVGAHVQLLRLPDGKLLITKERVYKK